MIYIGIDPGKSGGVAFVNDDGYAHAHKMPDTDRDLLNLLNDRRNCRASLERVNAGVWGHGKAGQMGVTSAFTFGKGYGAILMALTAASIPFDEVLPAKWQQVMGCRTGGDKNISKRRAQQLFPTLTVTHAIADALLLAEYCRRLHRQPVTLEQESHEQTEAQPSSSSQAIDGETSQASEDPAREVIRQIRQRRRTS